MSASHKARSGAGQREVVALLLTVFVLMGALQARISQYEPHSLSQAAWVALLETKHTNKVGLVTGHGVLRDAPPSVAFGRPVVLLSSPQRFTVRRDRQVSSAVSVTIPSYPFPLYFRPPPSLLHS